ncbi:hypothetical protein L209DRAFT_246964 [Thermothelomyces heterothallicus CBS 203.75]
MATTPYKDIHYAPVGWGVSPTIGEATISHLVLSFPKRWVVRCTRLIRCRSPPRIALLGSVLFCSVSCGANPDGLRALETDHGRLLGARFRCTLHHAHHQGCLLIGHVGGLKSVVESDDVLRPHWARPAANGLLKPSASHLPEQDPEISSSRIAADSAGVLSVSA